MSRAARRARGARIAALVSRSWRESPPPVDDLGDLALLAPVLHRSGAAGLAWRRIRASLPDANPAGEGLGQAYRMQVLAAALQRRHLRHVLDVFHAHGVRPIVLKGWAAARLYADPGLRPTGDLDLCVRPEEETAARKACAAVTEDCAVDLHVGLRLLDDRPFEEIDRRCEDVVLEGAAARVLGREDHLRLVALHLLGHGGWRPVWLADVAVALETRAAGFDWEWFAAGSPRRTAWAGAALRLAADLLGASLDGVPDALGTKPVPPWVASAILEAWGDEQGRAAQGARLPMRLAPGPVAVLRGLWARWPSPLEAAIGVGAGVGAWPRWPVQLAAGVVRGLQFARTLVEPAGFR